MKFQRLSATFSAAILLAACQPGPQQSAPGGQMKATTPVAAEGVEAVATVNGQPIPKALVDQYTQQLGQHGPGADRQQIIEQLIQQELISQEGRQKKLVSAAELAAQINSIERQMYARAAVQDFLKTHEPTDETLRAKYDKQFGNQKTTEYQARHILVKTEAEAKKIIAQLDKKTAKFEDLAKKLSQDPGSKSRGGDLGWFEPDRMVPEFSQAVAALNDSEYTKIPVKSQFGYHVISRTAVREKSPPEFEAVKPQLANLAKREALQAHLDELKAAAKIELLETAAAPAPADEGAKPASPDDAAPADNAPAEAPPSEPPAE